MITSHVLSYLPCCDKGGGLERCFFPLMHKAQIYGGGGYRMKIAVT